MVHIVDDDDAVRDSMRVLLESLGYGVCDHPSARDFLQRQPSSGQAILILDVNMPEMDGFALLELLKAREDALPVIMMSGRGDPALEDRVRRSGAIAFLSKPVGYEDLIAAMNRAFA